MSRNVFARFTRPPEDRDVAPPQKPSPGAMRFRAAPKLDRPNRSVDCPTIFLRPGQDRGDSSREMKAHWHDDDSMRAFEIEEIEARAVLCDRQCNAVNRVAPQQNRQDGVPSAPPGGTKTRPSSKMATVPRRRAYCDQAPEQTARANSAATPHGLRSAGCAAAIAFSPKARALLAESISTCRTSRKPSRRQSFAQHRFKIVRRDRPRSMA